MKNEKREIKRIGIVSTIKISLLFVVFGAVLQILYFLILKFLPAIALQFGIDSSSLTLANVVIYMAQSAISLMIAAIIGVALYNWFARMVGGIKIDLD